MTGREAGRSLDAEIAEKVMGWRWISTVVPGPGKTVLLHSPESAARFAADYLAENERRGYVGGPFPSRMPHYSTRIEAAWLVVEKMHAKDFDATVRMTGDGFYCEFAHYVHYPTERGVGRVDPREGNAALAICLAALKALASLPVSGETRE